MEHAISRQIPKFCAAQKHTSDTCLRKEEIIHHLLSSFYASSSQEPDILATLLLLLTAVVVEFSRVESTMTVVYSVTGSAELVSCTYRLWTWSILHNNRRVRKLTVTSTLLLSYM